MACIAADDGDPDFVAVLRELERISGGGDDAGLFMDLLLVFDFEFIDWGTSCAQAIDDSSG